MHFEPTYKGLKHTHDLIVFDSVCDFEPTYKGLKLG